MINIFAKKLGISQIFYNNNLLCVTLVKFNFLYLLNINKYNNIIIGQKKNYRNKFSKSYIGNFIKNKLFIFENKLIIKNNFLLNKNFLYKKINNLNFFNLNDKIKVKSKVIGKGYMGVIKKYHFKRGPETHGSKHHRLQGSLGAGTFPGRVWPGKKMSGRKKNLYATKNSYIINKYNNILILKGSLPGKINNQVFIKKI